MVNLVLSFNTKTGSYESEISMQKARAGKNFDFLPAAVDFEQPSVYAAVFKAFDPHLLLGCMILK